MTVVVDLSRYVLEQQTLILATERYDIVAHSIGDTSSVGQIVCLFGNT
jgi:hypothetical protein